ncbi:MAG TPA: glycosyltransferase [Solirubrobacterales bacterium]|nr:glycosyltransferase [Solirubrobacterales bacterium]
MTAPGAPLVSVAMRTYEHAPFISQAIESVLIQEGPFDYELVIGEDFSTDGTREIVARYAERYPERIRAVLPPANVGHGEILRRVLDATRGQFIAYLDGDDYWTSPAKLRLQAEYLQAHGECASCFHDASLVYDASGAPSGVTTPALAEASFALEDILAECFIPSPAMMFRREIAADLPGWAYDSAWIDWLIHIRCAERGPIGYIPEPLAAYRVHAGGMFSSLDRISQIEEDLSFYERLLPELPAQAELIERYRQFRAAQLAVERVGVPFKACVVLVDPRREVKPYFNGRHARNLPRRDGREVTELEAIRRAAADLAPAQPDYLSNAEVAGEGGCFVVVPSGARQWLRGRDGLRAYLEDEGGKVWDDGDTVVFELPLLSDAGSVTVRPTRRVEIVPDEPVPPELVGANLEAPAAGASLPAHAVTTIGWALGRDEPVEAVEFWVRSERVWRAPVDIDRPDLERGFPDREVGSPGFRTTINAQRLPADAEAAVFAVLPGERRIRFATLRFEDGSGG